MLDLPSDVAIQEALDKGNYFCTVEHVKKRENEYAMVIAFARFIEETGKKENSDFNQDYIFIRNLLSSWTNDYNKKEEINLGKMDSAPDFQKLLEIYRKMK